MTSYDRRSALKLSLGAVGLLTLPQLTQFARAAEDFIRGPRIKDHPIKQLSKHVWMIYSPDGFPTPENQGMMANITFVETAKGIVVIDIEFAIGAHTDNASTRIPQFTSKLVGRRCPCKWKAMSLGKWFKIHAMRCTEKLLKLRPIQRFRLRKDGEDSAAFIINNDDVLAFLESWRGHASQVLLGENEKWRDLSFPANQTWAFRIEWMLIWKRIANLMRKALFRMFRLVGSAIVY